MQDNRKLNQVTDFEVVVLREMKEYITPERELGYRVTLNSASGKVDCECDSDCMLIILRFS